MRTVTGYGGNGAYGAGGGEWPRARRRRRRHLVLLLASLVLIVIAVAFLAYIWWYNTSGPGFRDHPLFFGFGFLGFFVILLIGFWCIRLAMWSTRGGGYGYGGGGRYTGSLGPGEGGASGPPRRQWDPAVVEARRRYARGEITREQFQQIVQDLRASRGGGGGALP